MTQHLPAILQVLALSGGIVLFVLNKPDYAIMVMGAGNLAAAGQNVAATRKAAT